MSNKGVIKINDDTYPDLLKNTDKPPVSLTYKGDFSKDDFSKVVAVVGSRKITSYGKAAIEKIIAPVAGAGITIVSGFMYGVDAHAHEVAIKSGGRTIGVLPCGVDIVHPAYQKKLYQEVIKNGFFLSEYEDNMKPEKWTYPKRNRITVGVADATVIIEAEEKGGTMISADLAKKYNRPLFVVPGPIFSATSKGANELIKQKAQVVTCAEDILSFFNESTDSSSKKTNLTEEELIVVTVLEKEPCESDEIVRETKLSSVVVSSTLSSLEMQGVVKRVGFKYYLI